MFLLWNALALLAPIGSLATGPSVPKEPGMAVAQAIGATGAAVLGLLGLHGPRREADRWGSHRVGRGGRKPVRPTNR